MNITNDFIKPKQKIIYPTPAVTISSHSYALKEFMRSATHSQCSCILHDLPCHRNITHSCNTGNGRINSRIIHNRTSRKSKGNVLELQLTTFLILDIHHFSPRTLQSVAHTNFIHCHVTCHEMFVHLQITFRKQDSTPSKSSSVHAWKTQHRSPWIIFSPF